MVPHWCIAVVAALLLVTHTTAATAFSSPLTGSSFFWMTLTGTAAVKQQLQTDLESDMQAAAGAAGTVTVTDLNVNATALFVEYTIVSAGSVEAVQATVLASPLPTVEAYVETSKSSLSAIADLIPETVVFDPHVLYPRPPGSSPPEEPVIESITSYHAVFLSGDATRWSAVVKDEWDTLTLRLSDAALKTIFRSLVKTSVWVNAAEVYTAQTLSYSSRSASSVLGKSSGMVVRMGAQQSLHRGGYGLFTALQVTSLLGLMNLEEVNDLYNAEGVVEPTPAVVAVVSIADGDSQCGEVCIVRIMVVCIVVLSFIVILVGAIMYCACFKSPEANPLQTELDEYPKRYAEVLGEREAVTNPLLPELQPAPTPVQPTLPMHKCCVESPQPPASDPAPFQQSQVFNFYINSEPQRSLPNTVMDASRMPDPQLRGPQYCDSHYTLDGTIPRGLPPRYVDLYHPRQEPQRNINFDREYPSVAQRVVQTPFFEPEASRQIKVTHQDVQRSAFVGDNAVHSSGENPQLPSPPRQVSAQQQDQQLPLPLQYLSPHSHPQDPMQVLNPSVPVHRVPSVPVSSVPSVPVHRVPSVPVSSVDADPSTVRQTPLKESWVVRSDGAMHLDTSCL